MTVHHFELPGWAGWLILGFIIYAIGCVFLIPFIAYIIDGRLRRIRTARKFRKQFNKPLRMNAEYRTLAEQQSLKADGKRWML